jgi:octaprenyl-diphosphate synthase
MSGPVLSSVPSVAAGDLNDVFRRVAPQMTALDHFMHAQVERFEPEIQNMASYCLETSGKRLRPTLVFICGWQREGGINDDLVRVAGVVEMVHLATLVHDDIMDGAEIRRNRRTAAREFGADAAVLLGDALFSQALHIASQFPTTEVCRLVSESTRRVCSGEIMQTMRRRDTGVSLEDYYRVIDLKTAELFRVSCRLGAQLAGYPDEFVAAANDFGRHLGIAYQIYDDLVDFLGEEGKIGKTLGTDLASGKLTLPLMLLLEKLPSAERAAAVEAMRCGRPLPLTASVERMRSLGIAVDVVRAIDVELVTATRMVVPHRQLAPVEFMLQLCGVLKNQVDALAAIGVSDTI